MTDTAAETFEKLRELIGLPLSDSHRAADMRTFQIGPITKIGKKEVGTFTLHIQCAWRIENADGIVAGRDDLYAPTEETEDFDFDTWDWDRNETLQDRLVAMFLSTDPIIEDINTDAYGGAVIGMSNGYNLVLFPVCSKDEDWRLFCPNTEEKHFVFCGGCVEG